MSNANGHIDIECQESDDEYFNVKNKGEYSEGSDEEDDLVDDDGEGLVDEEEEEDLGDDDEEDNLMGDEEEAEEYNEFFGRNKEEDVKEDDIFNENTLLFGIKTREVLEQEILVLFSNMLKKETILSKDVKSNIPVDPETFKSASLKKNEKEGTGNDNKPNLKIKNKEVYNFIYSKMHQNENKNLDNKNTYNSDKREDGKRTSVSSTGLNEGTSILKTPSFQNLDKEHYILDPNIIQILRDINTYLKREREYLHRKIGTHIDSTFKNPMYVTLYIYNNAVLKDIIIQVINIIKHDFDNAIYKDIDENLLIKNIFILINYLTSRPSKEWFEYWHKHMPTFGNKKSEYNVYNYLQIEKSDRKIYRNALKNDIYIKELQKRSNIIEEYQKGLESLKYVLSDKNFISMLNEFRYNCQLFIDADYRGIEENEKLMAMQRKENELMESKRVLKEELQSYADNSSDEDDLSDDSDNSNDANPENPENTNTPSTPEDDIKKKNNIVKKKIKNIKKRINEINEELHDISNFFLEDKRKREKLTHEYKENIYLIRNILSQVLGIRNMKGGRDINLNNVHYAILQHALDKHSSLNLIIDEMINLFKKEIQKYEDEKNIHIPYLNQNTMKNIWEYVRLFYNVICYIDPIDLVKSLTYQKEKIIKPGRNSVNLGSAKKPETTSNTIDNKNKQGIKINKGEKRNSFLKSKKNNLMLTHLARINPLLAKQKIRKPNEEKHMKKKKKRYIVRKNRIDYYESISFEDLAFDIFSEEGSLKKHNILDIFDYTNLYKIQEFINNIIGINEEFENIYDTSENSYSGNGNSPFRSNENENNSPKNHEKTQQYAENFNYSLKVFLNICIKDLNRCISEYYNNEWDIKIILNIHAWILTYYTNYYKYENKKRLSNSREGNNINDTEDSGLKYTHTNSNKIEERGSPFISRIQMVLGMQMYIGDNSIHTEFLCDTFERIIREEKMRKNSSKIILCCLRCLYADLNLLDMHALSTDDSVKAICKSSLNNFLKRNILNKLSWILKNYKIMSHEKNIFIYSLKCSLLIIQLLEKLGGSTYIVKESKKKIYDEGESEENYSNYNEDEGYSNNNDHGYNTFNEPMEKVYVSNLVDEIYSGKIINICMQILENFKKNRTYINDLIITYFEYIIKHKDNEYNFLIFFDIKYFLIFKDIINDEQCYTNPHYYWIACFFENIISCFFKLWNSNNFIPIELFFSKDVNKNMSSLISENYMLSIFSNYNEGNDSYIYEQLTKGVGINDVFIQMNSRKRLEHLQWSEEDIQNLKLYFNQFKHMHSYLSFLSEMLNKPPNTVKNQLIYLNYIDKRGNVLNFHDYESLHSSGRSSSQSSDSNSESEDHIRHKKLFTKNKETNENAKHVDLNDIEEYNKSKKKQPLLFTIYKLKKLNEKQNQEHNLTTNEINCNVETVLEEMVGGLRSLYELKKLSKNKYLSSKAHVFDIPLSMSSDLLEHHYFKKLLTLLGFVYNNNSDEWFLDDNLDIDVFRQIVEKFEEFHVIPIQDLRTRLQHPLYKKNSSNETDDPQNDYSPSDSKKNTKDAASTNADDDDDFLFYNNDNENKVTHINPEDCQDEEMLHTIPLAKPKGTLELIKLMYEFFSSNDENFRIFFINLMNTISDRFNLLFEHKLRERFIDQFGNVIASSTGDNIDSFSTKKNDEKQNTNIEKYKIYLTSDEKTTIKLCYNREALKTLLKYLGIHIYSHEKLIIYKDIINDEVVLERIKVINNYKTLAIQDIKKAIDEKEELIEQKKKKKKEKKPTPEQKFDFIKRVCEYLHFKYVTSKMNASTNFNQNNVNQNNINDTYFGDDKLLNFIYEKLNSWNNKRNKKNDDQNLCLRITDLTQCIIIQNYGTDIAENVSDDNLASSYIPFIKNICTSIKGVEQNVSNEMGVETSDEAIYWICSEIHIKWIKAILKIFYNILFDTSYNTVGKLFEEYKNIKEILNDTSYSFLDNTNYDQTSDQVNLDMIPPNDNIKPDDNINEKSDIQENLHNDKPEELNNHIEEKTIQTLNINDEYNTSLNNYKKRTLNIDDNPSLRSKRKICETIMEHDYAHLFKKTKLQNSYINTYKKNRKLIISSLLNNKNIIQYKEIDIINKVKQIAIKARQMASTGDLRKRWKTREDVRTILLL
ncbi:conserved Plasmodium protein, unknown function [Plasmodium vinckei vinckei]|uniref:Uncharacterized protein n=1 Tax=Plasmodium vinckei vinckei TaxID=54757 RepID=A0A449BN29_PLAVN|nr:conserved Plasmodium protein, unknown function [Plasmodium vinckei vinckei]VEV54809.1 conserved Plasmodium protein, unknown function [Plasmodium vinckei vinckei]